MNRDIDKGFGMTREEMAGFLLSDTVENIARKFPYSFLVDLYGEFVGKQVDYTDTAIDIVEIMQSYARIQGNNPQALDRERAKELFEIIGEVGHSITQLQRYVQNPDFITNKQENWEQFVYDYNKQIELLKSIYTIAKEIHQEDE